MIYLCLSGLPPSSNNIYFNLPGGGRAMKANGKKFKNEAQTEIASKFPVALRGFVPNAPYHILLRLHFKQDDMLNPRWGKTPKASRYKKTDATNRIKIMEDVLKDVAGVDDSCTMAFMVQKVIGEADKTEIFAWNIDVEESPFDAVLFGL